MTAAFLILGCLVGLRFTPLALVWVVPAAAAMAGLASLGGLLPEGLQPMITCAIIVELGYFVGCCLNTAEAERAAVTTRDQQH